MEMQYLREFITLADTGSFTKAADRLFISQSSLSKHIKNIEKKLGAPLFNRTTNKIELNEFGQLFLPYAKKIIHIEDECTTAFLNKLQNTKETLTICSLPSMAQYNITDILVRFKKSNPNLTINLIQPVADLETMLRENKCELAFIGQVNDINNEFVKIHYTIDTLVAVFPKSNHLAKCKTVFLNQLKDEDFLLLPEFTKPHDLSISACKQNGFEPKVVFTDHRLENIIDLVAKEIGVALLMKKTLVYLSNPNVSIVDISPTVSTEINLCYKKNIDLSVAAKRFLRFLETEVHSHL